MSRDEEDESLSSQITFDFQSCLHFQPYPFHFASSPLTAWTTTRQKNLCSARATRTAVTVRRDAQVQQKPNRNREPKTYERREGRLQSSLAERCNWVCGRLQITAASLEFDKCCAAASTGGDVGLSFL